MRIILKPNKYLYAIWACFFFSVFPLLVFSLLIFSLAACSGDGLAEAGLEEVNSEEGELTRFSIQRVGYFDTVIHFIGYAPQEEAFNDYAQLFFQVLEEKHDLFDVFSPRAGVNNLYYVNNNAHQAPVVVDPSLISLLENSLAAYDMTQGIVNVALGPVLRLWHQHRLAGQSAPSLDSLQAANAFTPIDGLVINREENTVFFQHPYMQLDVGAIGKMYAVELAFNQVVLAGMPAFIVNAGGDILAHGHPPGRGYWNVGVQDPTGQAGAIDAAMLINRSLAASGGYERFFEIDGQHFGHIISPITLMPVDHFQQVVVVHPSPWLADVLATALFILPFEEGYLLAQRHGADAFWIDQQGKWFATPGYREISSHFRQEVEDNG